MSREFTCMVAGLLLWAACGLPALAQQDPEDQDNGAVEEPLADDSGDLAADGQNAGDEQATAGGRDGIDDIEDILEADDDIFAGGGYSYDAGDRRDPFRSLRQRNAVDLPRGPRPEGIPGLLIEEISLTGIFSTPEGTLAQVKGGGKDKSYLLREGDQLYDGDVVSISFEEVVFKQIINDPAAVKPFREVVKRLGGKK
ncbi:MAG: hypothetical protein KDD11_11870 [Acidobacteria bacterium]|nr:hypothetical protein [Acidobacteriota bacterium]